MAPRSRSQVYSRAKGTITRFGDVLGGGTRTSGYGNISDHVGPSDCDPLTIDHMDSSGGIINSKFNPGFFGSYAQAYLADILDFLDSNFPHLGSPSGLDLSNVDYATQAAARTNPSRPYVDIPVNVLQLGELTQLIQRRGRSIFSELGRENLRYQFAIAPLVGDLVKLTQFQSQVARRMTEIERLSGQKGLRRTLGVGSWSNSTVQSRTVQSNRIFFQKDFTVITTQTVRAHCRWLPDGDLSSMSTSDKQRLALRSVLGLTMDGSTLWEIIPWSWLIDWGSNVGSWMAANRNIIPATLSGVHIMRETRTEYNGQGHDDGSYSMEPIRVTRSTKTRAPSFVAPTAHFPFLSGNQMGILASLAVTRM